MKAPGEDAPEEAMLAMRGERMRGIRNLGGRAGMLLADRMRLFLRA